MRRYRRIHEPAILIGEPCRVVAMLDRDDMVALRSALECEAGQRTAEDPMSNLTRYTTFRGLILQLEEV